VVSFRLPRPGQFSGAVDTPRASRGAAITFDQVEARDGEQVSGS
jgi:hypothetical protein